jgi:hypothetical protein
VGYYRMWIVISLMVMQVVLCFDCCSCVDFGMGWGGIVG